MSQNSQRLTWSAQEVDAKLKEIMRVCFETCFSAGGKWSHDSVDGKLPSLLAGANVAGFIKVADAMREQGEWW